MCGDTCWGTAWYWGSLKKAITSLERESGSRSGTHILLKRGGLLFGRLVFGLLVCGSAGGVVLGPLPFLDALF